MNRPENPTNAQAGPHSLASGNPSSLEAVSSGEWLSALLDGECSAEGWDALGADSARMRGRWSDFHLVGEVLRAGPGGARPCDLGAVQAIMARVALEKPDWQTVPAATRAAASPALGVDAVTISVDPVAPANDSIFRWKMVAGLASVAAVVALAWPLTVGTPNGAGAQLAVAPAAPSAALVALPRDTVVSTESGVLVRDPELEALIAAHRQAGGMSALQMPAGFLRNATFEAPQR